jgi:NAD(P)-dependent dehydrogenase (short-subunit alcohol dehydrogenase family)
MSARAIVVTGASTGIGAACVADLAARDFTVFAGARTPAAVPADATGRVIPVRLDVTDPDSIAEAAALVTARVGTAGLAGLVNNAGIVVSGPIEILPLEALRRQLEVNVVGQVAVTQAFLPLLRAARGRIVNMSSVAGRAVSPTLGAYAASKFALEAISDALRQELQPLGVHVAVIEPGAIATPIWRKSLVDADGQLGDLPAHVTSLYGTVATRMRRMAERAAERAIPAAAVASAVHHALTAARPRTRYMIGADARLQVMVREWLPDRLGDAAVRLALRVRG